MRYEQATTPSTNCQGLRIMLNFLIDLKRQRRKQSLFLPDPNRDVFLVSYPRSGNTWVRAMLFHALNRRPPATALEVESMIPDIHKAPSQSSITRQSSYIIKNHHINRYKITERPSRVIHLVRDPRDVLLSYHRYQIRRHGHATHLREFAQDFCHGRIFPGSWQEHFYSWLPDLSYAPHQYLQLRYEDLYGDTCKSLINLADFIGTTLSKCEARDIVRHSDPEALDRLQFGSQAKLSESMSFVGPARSGTWKGVLPVDIENLVNFHFEKAMHQVDYKSK